MKKYQIVGAIALIAVMSGSIVFAAPADKEAKAVARENARVTREDAIADKKVERDEKIAEKKTEIEGKKVERICDRVDKTILRLKDRSEKRKVMNTGKIEKKLAQVQDKRVVQKKELQVQRQKRDEQRTVFYVAANLKADTDEQYIAVKTFEKIVEEAIAVRRKSIDDATVTLQTAVDKLVVDKVDMIEKSYATYTASYDTAITGAQTACGEGATTDDLKSIAKDLNGEFKVAGATFRSEIQGIQKIGKEVQKLVAIRKVAVKEAISVFKATVNPARAELIAVFGGELSIDEKDDSAPSDSGKDDIDDVDDDKDENENEEDDKDKVEKE